MAFTVVCFCKLSSFILLDVLILLWDDKLFSLFNACDVTFALAHSGGLVWSTPFGVLTIDLKPWHGVRDLVCLYASRMTFAFA